jgi:hypothetical protein
MVLQLPVAGMLLRRISNTSTTTTAATGSSQVIDRNQPPSTPLTSLLIFAIARTSTAIFPLLSKIKEAYRYDIIGKREKQEEKL